MDEINIARPVQNQKHFIVIAMPTFYDKTTTQQFIL